MDVVVAHYIHTHMLSLFALRDLKLERAGHDSETAPYVMSLIVIPNRLYNVNNYPDFRNGLI